jgi:hypothetical protein
MARSTSPGVEFNARAEGAATQPESRGGGEPEDRFFIHETHEVTRKGDTACVRACGEVLSVLESKREVKYLITVVISYTASANLAAAENISFEIML